MQTYEVKGPDGRIYRFSGPEGVPQAELEAAARREYLRQPAPDKSKEGFAAAAKAGTQRLLGEAALTAGKAGFIEPERAEQIYAAQQQRAGEMFQPTEASWFESPLLKLRELAGGSVPYMLAPLAVGGAGALAATGVGAPAAAGLAALGGAGLTSLTQFTGSNLARNVEEGKRLAETSGTAAVAAAIPQAALDIVSMRMIPGIGRIFGRAGVDISEETAQRIAQQTLRQRATDYAKATGKTMGVEGATESGQQLLERLQAGLSITDEDARKEYFESFVGGAVLGGAIAPFGTALERGRAVREGTRMGEERLKTGLEMGPPEPATPQWTMPAEEGPPEYVSGMQGPPTWVKGLEPSEPLPPKLGYTESPEQRRSRVEQGIADIEAELQARAQGTEPLTPEQIIALDAQMEPKRQQLEALKQELADIGPPPPAPPSVSSLQQQEKKLLKEMEAARGRGDLSLQARLARRLVEVRRLMGQAPTEEAMPQATAEIPTPEVPAAEAPQAAPDLYSQAVEAVQAAGKPTVSTIQQALGIGYKPAAKLLKQMEEEGVVTPPQANGRRALVAQPQAETPAQPQTEPPAAPEATEALPEPTKGAVKPTELTEEAVAPTKPAEAAAPAPAPALTVEPVVEPVAEEEEAPLPEFKQWPPRQEQPAEGAAPAAPEYWGPPKLTPARAKRTDEYERNLMGALRRLVGYFEPKKVVNPETQEIELSRPEPTETQVEAIAELLTRGLERGGLRAEAERETRAKGMAGPPPRMRGVNIDEVRDLVNDIAKSPEQRQAVREALRDPAGSDFFDMLSKRLLTRQRREFPVRKPTPAKPAVEAPVQQLSKLYQQAAQRKLDKEDQERLQKLRPLMPRIAQRGAEVKTRQPVVDWLEAVSAGKATPEQREALDTFIRDFDELERRTALEKAQRAQRQAELDAKLKAIEVEVEKAVAPAKARVDAIREAISKLEQATALEAGASNRKRNEALTGLTKAEKELETLRNELSAKFSKEFGDVVEKANRPILSGARAQFTADYSAAQRLILMFERGVEKAEKLSIEGGNALQAEAIRRLRDTLSEFRQAYESDDTSSEKREEAAQSLENSFAAVKQLSLPAQRFKLTQRFNEMMEFTKGAIDRYAERMERVASVQQTLRDINAARLMALSTKHAVTKADGDVDRLLALEADINRDTQAAALAEQELAAIAVQFKEKKSELRQALGELRAQKEKAVEKLTGKRPGAPALVSNQVGKALIQLDEDLLLAIDPVRSFKRMKRGEALKQEEAQARVALASPGLASEDRKNLEKELAWVQKALAEDMAQADDEVFVTERGVVRLLMGVGSPQAIARLEQRYGKEAREAEQRALRAVYGDMYGSDNRLVQRRIIEFERGLTKKQQEYVAALEERYAHLMAQKLEKGAVSVEELEQLRAKAKERLKAYEEKAKTRAEEVANAYAKMVEDRGKVEDALTALTDKLNAKRDPLIAAKDALIKEKARVQLLTGAELAPLVRKNTNPDTPREQLLAQVNAKLDKQIADKEAAIVAAEQKFATKHDALVKKLANINSNFEQERGVRTTFINEDTRTKREQSLLSREAQMRKDHEQVMRGQTELAMLITHKTVDRIAARQRKRRVTTPLMRNLSMLAQYYGRSASGANRYYRKHFIEGTRPVERDRPLSAFEIGEVNKLADEITGKPAAVREAERPTQQSAGRGPFTPINATSPKGLEQQLTEEEAAVLARTAINFSEISEAVEAGIATSAVANPAKGRVEFRKRIGTLLLAEKLKGESPSRVTDVLNRLYAVSTGEAEGLRRPLTEAERVENVRGLGEVMLTEGEFTTAVARARETGARQLDEQREPEVGDEEASALRNDNSFYEARGTVTPLDADVAKALSENNLKEALRLLSENAKSPEHRETAKRLADMLDKVKVELADDVRLDGTRVEGKYDP